MRKKISIVIPTFNEEGNVVNIHKAVKQELEKSLSQYEYELIFIDNCSTDNTRQLIRELCRLDKHTKAIFNIRNFGAFNSPYYGLLQASGDCAILFCADFQDPVEMIPVLVKEWETGEYKVVSAIKTSSKENKIKRFLRTCYYKMIKKMSDIEQIEHFTGFGLYDRAFLEILRSLKDPTPFLRGIVAELGYKRKEIPYQQQKRASGKTHNSWAALYDAAMLSFTSYTTVGLRLATVIGFVFSGLSLTVAVIYLILKLIYWDRFLAGMTPVLLVVCILGSLLLFFMGLLGEYVLSINKRIMNRPLVVEEERINFEEGI